jgi:transmembrane 9 superfamily member 2/4
MMTRFARIAVLAALVVSQSANAFYLPGIAPVSYPRGANLEVMANKLTSVSNQLPYDYYSLPFCGSNDIGAHKSKHVNLGQLLVGERMKPTDYILAMDMQSECNVLCTKTYSVEDVKKMEKFIGEKYKYVGRAMLELVCNARHSVESHLTAGVESLSSLG